MNPKSTFVTVVAWIFIILSGFASLVIFAQTIVVSTMLETEGFQELAPAIDSTPGVIGFMFQNFHLLIYAAFAVVLFTFASSIALLKRKNWGRLAFITLLTLAIIWDIGTTVAQFVFLSDSMSSFDELSGGQISEDFESMSQTIVWFSVIITVLFCGLLGWIIKRLISPEIVAEFTLNKPEKQPDN